MVVIAVYHYSDFSFIAIHVILFAFIFTFSNLYILFRTVYLIFINPSTSRDRHLEYSRKGIKPSRVWPQLFARVNLDIVVSG